MNEKYLMGFILAIVLIAVITWFIVLMLKKLKITAYFILGVVLFLLIAFLVGNALGTSRDKGDIGIMILVWSIILSMAVAVLYKRIRNKVKEQANPDSEPPENADMLNNPISNALSPKADAANEKMVSIYKLNNLAEAMALKAFLEEENIVCKLNSFGDLAYDGIWQEQKGWGMLQVFESDKDKATELLRNYFEEKSKETVLAEEPLTGAKEPIAEPSDEKPFKGVLFKIGAVLLIGIFLGWLLEIIIWWIRHLR